MTTPPLTPRAPEPAPAVDLFTAALRIHADGAIHTDHTGMRMDVDTWQLAAFRLTTDEDAHADRWEIHPDADEAVCCLTGRLRLQLRPAAPGGPVETTVMRPGTAVVIPRGRWHRFELDEPSDLLAVTLTAGSLVEPYTP
ncbi:cupin domain-containing protein [Yinghuangia seranimata]|uniref:cupin domain-containing protein n=1 Tax=Yinghuangia seranimata TaxID=408067 RepID=UPI00248C4A04|nr:cupin domain-containing protein [Yinghuangia seranimata]MDI2127740.1 cupin domain-containing protein [Yinghuangia seranimata]